jgi:tetratricopeptide (TPR) repeat protein
LWAERYDRKLEELFTLQSEIAEKIVAALETQLTLDEVGRIRRGTTHNVKAWEHYVRGMHELNSYTPVTVRIAKAEFKKALELDPDFVAALLGLGWVHLFGAINFYTVSGGMPPSTSRELATELARRVITLDKNNAESFALLSQIFLIKGQHDMSISHARNAVELHPNGADWHAYLAEALALSGRGNEALKEIDFTLRLNPTYPESYYYQLGLINYIVGRFEEAIPPLEWLLERASTQTWGSQPDKTNRFRLRIRSRYLLIASLSAGGRISQAKQMAAEILELWPYLYMTEFIALRFQFKNPEDMERMVGHLVQAGLPE